jgi:hypothetical protein
MGGTAAARTAVRSVLQAWGFTDANWLYDATVVVSELVATRSVTAVGSWPCIFMPCGVGSR